MANREATTAMEHRQLDIFEDARDVALRNDLAGAVERCDSDAARAATAALRSEFGDDPVLPPAQRLVAHIETQQGAQARFDAAQVLAWRGELEGEIDGAAHALLGAQAARAWLAAQWRWLADRAHTVPWHTSHADAHAAPLYLRAGDWAAAAEAAVAIESWRRIPLPLLWVVHAHWRLGRMDGPTGAWPLLAEALWLAPTRAAALIPQLADPRLDRLASGFESDFDPATDDWAWLPAWALVDQPGLLATLAPADAPADCAPADGYGLVAALLRLERQGRHHEIVAHRRRLKALSQTLFVVYMRTR
ncbi:hypothetical protein [Sphaerotilus sp.]|uniref:hypothetical protein n=1 Tax=Sphaerotilus sp. TaxID=2093942 RepID=UPI002ACF0149|nr:hypothetical protein [Sphaerotilus sp.]MDZ7855842.1 hypothetical protein [Sphaerotilus sp.]